VIAQGQPGFLVKVVHLLPQLQVAEAPEAQQLPQCETPAYEKKRLASAQKKPAEAKYLPC
jgi:hypothetical protein